MNDPILPGNVRKKIAELSDQGYSTIDIFDSVLDEAEDYVDSHEQLSRCISRITKSQTNEPENGSKNKRNIPPPKSFDALKYSDIINKLSKNMQEKEFEGFYTPIVLDILENYEGFESVKDANGAQGFTNPPFDFFAFKNGNPFIIEIKGSLENFNAPGETQKRRMRMLLNEIGGLNVALLQVKFRESEYRIFYNDEMSLFFDGREQPIEPIIQWIRDRIKNTK